MTDQLESVLQRFYDALRDSLVREGLRGSIFHNLILKKNSTKLQTILRQSTISGSSIDPAILKDISARRLVLPTDEINQYIISVRGIWEIENRQNIISIENLLDFYDTKVFRYQLVDQALIPREKVVVFSLLAIRAYSKEFAVNLNKDDTALEAWINLVKETIEKLKEIGELPEGYSIQEFYNVSDGKRKRKTKPGNILFEHPLVYVFRRIYQLPEKTKNIVQNPGNRQYFLDLWKNEEFYQEGLKFLITRVFTDITLSIPILESISLFFEDISFRYAPLIFDYGSNPFLSPKFSEKIKDYLIFNIL